MQSERRTKIVSLCLVVLTVATFSIMGVVLVAPAGAASPSEAVHLFALSNILQPLKKGGQGGGGHGGGGGSTPTAPATSPPYSPSQIRAAYGYSQTYNGAGETIAIIDAYGSPSIQNDLNYFDAAYGLPSITISIVKLGGHISRNAGWALETSLDVEWAHVMAPAANIVLIETSSASSSMLITTAIGYAVNTTHANVISMSWGMAESQMTSAQIASYDTTLQYAAQHGSILVAASGDSGANDGTSAPTVNFPAASPYVVGVGGTTLNIAVSGGVTTYTRTAWNSSGGGVSAYFNEPAYQSGSGIQLTGRGVPDVSYDANPNTGVWIYDTTTYEGLSGWIGVGGTSAGAPQWSAIFADGNQYQQGAALSGVAVLNALYSAYSSSSYTSAFHDITSGYNGYYSAGPGYDEVTGIGSPDVANLLPLL